MRTKSTIIGAFLVVFGALMFLGNLGLANDFLVLLLISLAFLFVYALAGAWNRKANIGFLIPGVITGVIGLYVMLEENGMIPAGADTIFLVMLGAGFLLIMLIHTMRSGSKSWGEKYWPVFPGGILVMVGSIDLAAGVSNSIYSMITPSIFVLVGLYMLISQFTSSRKKVDGRDTDQQRSKQSMPETTGKAQVNLKKEAEQKK